MTPKFVKAMVSASTALSILASSVTPALAVETTAPRGEKRCEVVQKKIEARVSTYKQNRDNHRNVYQRIKDKAQTFVDKAKAKGLDTSTLEADLRTLQGKIETFVANADAFIKKLEEANDYNCGQSEGVFMQKLNEAKELGKTARQSAMDVRSYVRETIKTDVKNLKDQKPSTTSTPTQ